MCAARAAGELLVKYGADPHAIDNDGRSPKDIATLGQEPVFVEWLAQFSTDKKASDTAADASGEEKTEL